jgi:integrase
MDLNTGWWTIPAKKAKNKLSHRVPLSPLAMQLLERVKALSGSSKWLFPSTQTENAMLNTSIDHALRRNQSRFGIPTFTPHDLRRTAASHMTGLGISRLTVSKILNHVESGITAVYDRHSYDQEKRDALNLWAEKIASIIA